MGSAISAARANREFSHLIRKVREGASYVVTSHGRPVARILPIAGNDAVILASAADAGCRLLLSEELQEGFTWSGVTVTNPFVASRHPLLDAMLTAQEA